MNSSLTNKTERSKRSLLLRFGAKKANKNKVLPQNEEPNDKPSESAVLGVTSPIIIFRTHNNTISSEMFLFNPSNFNLPADVSTGAVIELEHVNESVTVVNNEDKANKERTLTRPVILTQSTIVQNVCYNKNNYPQPHHHHHHNNTVDYEHGFECKNSPENWICLAKACSDEQLARTNFAISVHTDLIQKIPFINYAIQWKAKATVLRSETEMVNRYGLTHLLLSFEHQYISRSDMLVINRALCNRIVYAGEEIVVCGLRLQVVELLRMNESYESTLTSNCEKNNLECRTFSSNNIKDAIHINETVRATNHNDSAHNSAEENIRTSTDNNSNSDSSSNNSKMQNSNVLRSIVIDTDANLQVENEEANFNSDEKNNITAKHDESQHLQEEQEKEQQQHEQELKEQSKNLHREKQVACGLITQHTLINYESKSPVYYIYLELSSEMWHSTLDGRIHLCWALKKFIPHLLHELNNRPNKASPRIRVVFSGRLRDEWTWANNTFAFECTSHTSCNNNNIIINNTNEKKQEKKEKEEKTQTLEETFLKKIKKNNKKASHQMSHDVFHILEIPQEVNEEIDAAAEIECHCEAFIDAIRTSVCKREYVLHKRWETESCQNQQDALLSQEQTDKSTIINENKTSLHAEDVLVSDLFTSSEMSNTMNGLSVILEECAEHHHNNKLLTCTGYAITIVSAGNGLYRVCNDVIQSICASVHDMGIQHVNLVCLGRPPLHHSPLLVYNTRTDPSLRRQYHLLNNCYSIYEVESAQNLLLLLESSSLQKLSSSRHPLKSINTKFTNTTLEQNDKDNNVQTSKERVKCCNVIKEVRCGEASVYYEIPPWLNCYCYHPIPPSLLHHTLRSKRGMEHHFTKNYKALCNVLGNSGRIESFERNMLNSFELLEPEVWRAEYASALLPQVAREFYSDNNINNNINVRNYENKNDNTNGVIISGVHMPHMAHHSSWSLKQRSLLESEELQEEEEEEGTKLLLPAMQTNTELQSLQEKECTNIKKKFTCENETQSCVTCTWYKVKSNANIWRNQATRNKKPHNYNRNNSRSHISPLQESEEHQLEWEQESEVEYQLENGEENNEEEQKSTNASLNYSDNATSVGVNLLTSELTRSDNYQLMCELRLTEEWVAAGWRWSTRLLSRNNSYEKKVQLEENYGISDNGVNNDKDNSLWLLFMSSLFCIQDRYGSNAKRITKFIEYILFHSLNSNNFDDSNINNNSEEESYSYDSGTNGNDRRQEDVLSELLQCDLEFNKSWEHFQFFVQELSYLSEDNTVLVLAWEPFDQYVPPFSNVPWQILLWLQASFMTKTLPDANEERNNPLFIDKCNSEFVKSNAATATITNHNKNNNEMHKWNDKFITIGHVQVDHSLLFAIEPVHPLHGLSGISSIVSPFNMSESFSTGRNTLAFPWLAQPQNFSAVPGNTINSRTIPVNVNYGNTMSNENRFTCTNNSVIDDNFNIHSFKKSIRAENERFDNSPVLLSPTPSPSAINKMTITPSSTSVRTSQSILDNITTRRVLNRRWVYCHPERTHNRAMEQEDNIELTEHSLDEEHRMTEPISEASHNYLFYNTLHTGSGFNYLKGNLYNWRQLCACLLLPLYGTRTVYVRDAFKVIQPHQYTFTYKTSSPSASTPHKQSAMNLSQNTMTGVSAFNSISGSGSNKYYYHLHHHHNINMMRQIDANALDREEKLLEFIKQRLQQQYQLILDTTSCSNNTLSKYNTAIKSNLSSLQPTQQIPATFFNFQTSYATLEPNSKIELSIGHQVHWLKLTETLREVNISREEHCGRYCSNDAQCPSLIYSFFIWNYYKNREKMSETMYDQSSNANVDEGNTYTTIEVHQVKCNTEKRKEQLENKFIESVTPWTLNEITPSFVLRKFVEYAQISKHHSLPWEILDYWLEHHPTHIIPRLLRNALRVRQVAVVLLPPSTCESNEENANRLSDMAEGSIMDGSFGADSRAAIHASSSFDISSSLSTLTQHNNNTSMEKNLPAVPFDEFNKFISHRFSVHLSMQNSVSWEEDHSKYDIRILHEQLQRRLHITCKSKYKQNSITNSERHGSKEVDLTNVNNNNSSSNLINQLFTEVTTTTRRIEATHGAISDADNEFNHVDEISETANYHQEKKYNNINSDSSNSNVVSVQEIQGRMTRMQAILVRDIGLRLDTSSVNKERESSLKPHSSQRSLTRLRHTESSSRITHSNNINNTMSSCASQEERMMSVDIDLPRFYNSHCVYVLQVWWLSCAGYIVNDWFKSFIANASRVKLRAIPISCYEVDYNELVKEYNNSLEVKDNNISSDNVDTNFVFDDDDDDNNSCTSEDDTGNMTIQKSNNANALYLQYEVTFAMLYQLILQRLCMRYKLCNCDSDTKEKAVTETRKEVTRKECNEYIFHVINRLVCLLLTPEFHYLPDGPTIQFYSRLIHSSGLCEVQIVGEGNMALVWRENYVYKHGTLAQVKLLQDFQHAVDIAIQQALNNT